jgi:hypothetical protein
MPALGLRGAPGDDPAHGAEPRMKRVAGRPQDLVDIENLSC